MSFATDKEFWRAMCVVRDDMTSLRMMELERRPRRGNEGDIGGLPREWLCERGIKFRCRNDHVGIISRSDLRFADLGDGDPMCPRCHQIAFITSPIDHDGPFLLFEAVQMLQGASESEDDVAQADNYYGFAEENNDDDDE